jgi:hypothetical protein
MGISQNMGWEKENDEQDFKGDTNIIYDGGFCS